METHSAKMARKKAARSSIVPGFTPMFNKQISKAYTAIATLQSVLFPSMSPQEIHQRADAELRRKLPAARHVRSYLPTPSRNDDPVYRKQATAVVEQQPDLFAEPPVKPKRASRARKAVASC